MKTTTKYIAPLLTLALFTLGCAQQNTSPNQPLPQNPATQEQTKTAANQQTISISNFTFDPATTTVKAGTTVTWINHDSFAHKITSSSSTPAGTTFTSNNFSSGEKYSFTFTKPGTYVYTCPIHPLMKGTIIVNP